MLFLRRLFGTCLVATLALSFVTAVLTFVVFAFGYATGSLRAVPVLSNSMEPAYHRGDLVLMRSEPSSSVKVGQVILIHGADNAPAAIMHRVVSATKGNQPVVHTKGDANTTQDTWQSQLMSKRTWRASTRVPNVASVVWFMRSTPGQVLLGAILIPFFLVSAFNAIWKRQPVSTRRRSRFLRTRRTRSRVRTTAIVTMATITVAVGASFGGWTSTPSAVAGTYGTSDISTSYPTNPSCTWANSTGATMNWTANADTRVKGYEVAATQPGAGTTTKTQFAGGATTTGTVTIGSSAQSDVVRSTTNIESYNNAWRSAATTDLPTVACERQTLPFAGTGTTGSTNGGTAAVSTYSDVVGIARDSTYTYFSDGNRIRRVTNGDRTPITVAGSATGGATDNTTGTSATLNAPQSIALTNAGWMFVADSASHDIRAVAVGSSPYAVITVAGSGSTGHADGTGASATFGAPSGLAYDQTNGILYVSDSTNATIRAVAVSNTPTANSGVVTTLAGGGAGGLTTGCLDATGTAARFNAPRQLSLYGTNLYVADKTNNVIRQVTTAGVVTTVGSACVSGAAATAADTGNGGLATSAAFNNPIGLTTDNYGNIYVVDSASGRIRVIAAADSKVYLIAGSSTGSTADPGAGLSAQFSAPKAIAVDTTAGAYYGELYVGDGGNFRVRELTRTTQTSVLGTPTPTNPNANDPTHPVSLGMQFSTDVAGYAMGVRFYKGTLNTGAHSGYLYSTAGTQLASTTFAGETASGWQSMYFTTPVALTASTSYRVNYTTNSQKYAFDTGFHTSAINNGNLHAPAGASLYNYSSNGAYPFTSTSGANYGYYVDIIFMQ